MTDKMLSLEATPIVVDGQIFSKEDSDAVHAFVIERSQHAYHRQMALEKADDE